MIAESKQGFAFLGEFVDGTLADFGPCVKNVNITRLMISSNTGWVGECAEMADEWVVGRWQRRS